MIPSPRFVATLSVAAALLTACGLQRIPPPAQRSTLPPPTLTPARQPAAPPSPPPTLQAQRHTPVAPALASADAALLDHARSRFAEASQAWSAWPERVDTRTLLGAADSAARSGDAAGVRSLASEVLRRAEDALDVHFLLRADLELQKLQTYTGLSDEQLERMRVAEVALASRHGRRAWNLLNALNRELAEATKRYVVAAGDSLWIISGRPEVYGNPYLWPLIWDANLDAIKDPNQLRAGQRLKIRGNPTIDEVVRAVDTARSYRSATVRIGEVREAPP